ncbi:MAG: GNAT family N-acetyltransferase, partial [Patescibacteria group bacterium]
MNIEIKKLSANDWQIFKELRLQMLKEEPQAFARTYDEVSKRTDEEWKENTENEEAGILAVWLDGKLAGMNGYYYPERSIVEIWGMFIRKQFRGMGLGKKLMGEIEK